MSGEHGPGTAGRRSVHRVELSVNVDHVATLRQARGTDYPDPVEAARLAEGAGAWGITAHLRGDRRHIQERDIERLRAGIAGRLNLELAATSEMLAVAERVRPQQVTLVPERPDEVTTEGGLDLVGRREEVAAACERLAAASIALSLFLDPDPAQIDALSTLPAGTVGGFEINTDAYTKAAAGRAREAELAKVDAAARRGGEMGLAVYAGHGLTAANVFAVARVSEIEELNIGHWLISRAVALGLPAAVREMLAAIADPSPAAGD